MKVCLEATIEQRPPERASERPPRRRRRADQDLRHDLLAPALDAGQDRSSEDAAPLSYSVSALAVLSPRQSELAAEPPARQHQALTPGEGHAGVEDPWLLNELFEQAAHDPAGPLPQQPLLESLAGQPLEQVQVYSGPRARASLALLGAEAATRGRQILLAAAEPPLETLLHEVIHVLQSERGGAAQVELTPAGAPPEREAETLVESLLTAGGAHQEQRRQVGPALRPGRDPLQPPVQAGLGPYAIALRRTTDAQPLPSGVEPSTRKPEETFATAVAERVPEPPRPAEQRASAEEPARVAEERERQREEAREGKNAGDVGGEAGAFELPPPPEPGIAEEDVAAREEALAEAEAALEQAADPEGLVGAFAAAPPTLKARRHDALGEDLTGVAQQEDAQFQAELPDFHAQLSGEVAPAPELEVGAPEGGEVALEQAPPAPAPEPEVAPTVDPGPYSENEALVRDLLRMFFGDSADRAEDVGDALRRVETSDAEIDDSPGPPPPVPLEGETDPERVNSQASEGLDQSREKRDEAQRAVLEGPGPERAQPRVMDEVVTLPELPQPALEQLAPVEGAEAYLAMELPPEVQTAFDQQQQAAMQASMEGARAEVARATDERDTARAGELDKANQQAEELNQQADAQQRDQVMQARHQIQDSRQATMQAQGDAVQALETEVAAERASQLEAIDDRVTADEATIAERYEQAESDAEAKIEEGEGKAEAERKEAEKEAEEESWWDAAVDFIEDAFEALTDAINAIFDAVRDAVNAILDAVKDFAIGLIDAAASFIKGAIGLFGEFLKGAVDLLLSDTFPGLAAELNEAIDGAVVTLQEGVDVVADGLKGGISALVEGLRAGLNAILDVFQGAVNAALALAEAALTGDWAELARKALEAILKVAGISPEDFYAFVGRAADTFQLIVADPGAFLGHCVDAVVAGVEKFAGNFLDHLKRGIIAWLTGALGDLTMPERFDLAGILDLARQILGLTWDRLRARAVKYLGAEAVEMVEFVVDHLQTLIEGGWAALFERVKEELSGVYDTVLEGIKSFLVREVIEAAITKLATMFNPVGAIVQLVLTAWNLFNFLRNQLERIMQVVRTVVDAIGEIARGVIEPAAGKVEEVLGNLLPIAIDLLASLFGVTGVSRQVRNVIEGIRERVDAAIDRLVDKVKAMFKRGAKGDKADVGGKAADGEAVARPAIKGSHKEIVTATLKRVDAADAGTAPEEKIAHKKQVAKEAIAEATPQLAQGLKFTVKLKNEEQASAQGTLKWQASIRPNDETQELEENLTSTPQAQPCPDMDPLASDPCSKDVLKKCNIPDGSKEKPLWIKWHKRATADLKNVDKLEVMLTPGGQKQPIIATQKTTVIADLTDVRIEEAEKDYSKSAAHLEEAKSTIKDIITGLDQADSNPILRDVLEASEGTLLGSLTSSIKEAKATKKETEENINPKKKGKKKVASEIDLPQIMKNARDQLKRAERNLRLAEEEFESAIRKPNHDLEQLQSNLVEAQSALDEAVLRFKEIKSSIDELKSTPKQIKQAEEITKLVRDLIDRNKMAKATKGRVDLLHQSAQADKTSGKNLEKRELGIDPACQIYLERGAPSDPHKLGPRIRGPERKEERKFKRFMKAAGLDMEKEQLAPEHITEITLSGPDTFGNLWPCSENPNPADKQFNLCTGKDIELETAAEKQMPRKIIRYLDMRENFYMVVKAVKQ